MIFTSHKGVSCDTGERSGDESLEVAAIRTESSPLGYQFHSLPGRRGVHRCGPDVMDIDT